MNRISARRAHIFSGNLFQLARVARALLPLMSRAAESILLAKISPGWPITESHSTMRTKFLKCGMDNKSFISQSIPRGDWGGGKGRGRGRGLYFNKVLIPRLITELRKLKSCSGRWAPRDQIFPHRKIDFEFGTKCSKRTGRGEGERSRERDARNFRRAVYILKLPLVTDWIIRNSPETAAEVDGNMYGGGAPRGNIKFHSIECFNVCARVPFCLDSAKRLWLRRILPLSKKDSSPPFLAPSLSFFLYVCTRVCDRFRRICNILFCIENGLGAIPRCACPLNRVCRTASLPSSPSHAARFLPCNRVLSRYSSRSFLAPAARSWQAATGEDDLSLYFPGRSSSSNKGISFFFLFSTPFPRPLPAPLSHLLTAAVSIHLA